MPILLALVCLLGTAVGVVFLASGGRDVAAWLLLGFVGVVVAGLALGDRGARLAGALDGLVLGAIVGTVTISVQRRRIRRARAAAAEEGSGDGSDDDSGEASGDDPDDA